jgi:membrane associated rhomboid family serine protease
MKPPPFAWFLAFAFVAAGLVAWLPVRLGGVHGYQTPALALSLAWFGLFALGLRGYGRRALLILPAAPPALFWLLLIGAALACDGGRCG